MLSRSFATLVLAAMTLLPARAQSDLEWILFTSEDFASLTYGIPQSDYAVVSFRCGPDTEGVAIAYDFEPEGAIDGMELAMVLQSGEQSLVLEAIGYRAEMDDAYFIETVAPLDASLTTLFAGDTLLVSTAGADDEYPSPAPGLAEEFFAACETETASP